MKLPRERGWQRSESDWQLSQTEENFEVSFVCPSFSLAFRRARTPPNALVWLKTTTEILILQYFADWTPLDRLRHPAVVSDAFLSNLDRFRYLRQWIRRPALDLHNFVRLFSKTTLNKLFSLQIELNRCFPVKTPGSTPTLDTHEWFQH